MKPTSLFLVLLLAYFASPFDAAARCDTLQLKDQPPQLVEVEQLSTALIRYRPCGQTRGGIRKVAWNQVEDYRPTGSDRKGMQAANPAKNPKAGPDTRNKWIFTHRSKEKEFVIHEGDRLTVEHYEYGQLFRSKGFLHTIDDNLLYVRNDYGYVFPVSRDKVLKIKRHRKGGKAGQTLGALSIGLGVLIAIGVLLASLMLAMVSIAMFMVAPFSDNKGPKEPGCTVPILILLAGAGIFALSQPKAIKDPFGANWQVRVEYPAHSIQPDATPLPDLGEP